MCGGHVKERAEQQSACTVQISVWLWVLWSFADCRRCIFICQHDMWLLPLDGVGCLQLCCWQQCAAPLNL